MEQYEKDLRKNLSQIGWSLFWMMMATLISQSIISETAFNYLPEFYNSSWYGFTTTAISLVLIGLPVFYLIIRKVPDSQHHKIVKLNFSQFIRYFFVCITFMYLANYLGAFINFIISRIKGQGVVNPVEEAIAKSNIYLNLVYVSVIGPMIEELIFRKLLLNKLRQFGDLPAILLSGFAFGLFHMNLSQFLYASVLGFIFAYITIRTNTIRYTIILHIMINFFNSIVAFLVVKTGNLALTILLGIWVISSIVIGLIIFAIYKEKITLEKVEFRLKKKSQYIFNAGSMMFLITCLYLIICDIILS